MAVAWTLEYGGVVKSLDAWGIRDPRLTFRNLDVDDFTFAIERDDVLAAPAFPAGADLLLRRDDVGWFRGKVARPAANAGPKQEFDSYLVQNVWQSLSRTVYQQDWCIGGVTYRTPRVTLGQNNYGQKISIGRQIFEVIQYAMSQGVLVAPGAMPVFTEMWLREERDLTCAGAIKTVLQLLPSAVGWVDYTSTVPVLNVRENFTLDSVTIDATSAVWLIDFSGLSPRSDLTPVGVKFIYQGTEIDETHTPARVKTTLTFDTAGLPDVEGCIVALVELADGETAPAGAALSYYTALQVTPWEGTVRIKERECSGLLRPGKVLNISNARAEWAAMRGVVQIVTEDLWTGETTAEIGLAEHLSPQDFIEIQRVARRRPAPTQFPNVQPCLLPGEDPGDPEEGEPPPEPEENPDAGVDPAAKEHEVRNERGGGNGLPTGTMSGCDEETGEDLTLTVFVPDS